jgi:hypothetical protein
MTGIDAMNYQDAKKISSENGFFASPQLFVVARLVQAIQLSSVQNGSAGQAGR